MSLTEKFCLGSTRGSGDRFRPDRAPKDRRAEL